MSGSEIMTEVAKRTHSHWKPSPGSVYPLLAWLQEKGYSKEVPEQEPGTKRYALTDQGEAFLEEHEKRREKFRKRTGFFPPPFIGLHWFDHYPKKANELVEAGKRLVMSSWNLLADLREGYSEDAVVKATEVLEQAAERIEEISSKLKDTRVE